MTFERRAVDKNGHALVSTTLEADGFLAAFTERTGGSSPRPYDSMNLSYFVGDEEDLVRENRHTVVESLGLPPFATAEQVHGTRVVRVGAKRAGTGFDDPEGRVLATDALSTTSASVALAVLTADCVPMVAVSPRSGLLVVAHLGWRGIAGGLVAAVAGLFDDPKGARVALGPAIGPDHYEVGEDVALAVAAGTGSGAVTARRDGRTFLDLAGTIRSELRQHGIRRVDDTGLCTACEHRRFYSYRVDEDTGRQAAVAVRLR